VFQGHNHINDLKELGESTAGRHGRRGGCRQQQIFGDVPRQRRDDLHRGISEARRLHTEAMSDEQPVKTSFSDCGGEVGTDD